MIVSDGEAEELSQEWNGEKKKPPKRVRQPRLKPLSKPERAKKYVEQL
jgi:hypothetical protein